MPQRNRVAKAIFDIIFYDISIFDANYLGIPFLSASNLKCIGCYLEIRFGGSHDI